MKVCRIYNFEFQKAIFKSLKETVISPQLIYNAD